MAHKLRNRVVLCLSETFLSDSESTLQFVQNIYIISASEHCFLPLVWWIREETFSNTKLWWKKNGYSGLLGSRGGLDDMRFWHVKFSLSDGGILNQWSQVSVDSASGVTGSAIRFLPWVSISPALYGTLASTRPDLNFCIAGALSEKSGLQDRHDEKIWGTLFALELPIGCSSRDEFKTPCACRKVTFKSLPNFASTENEPFISFRPYITRDEACDVERNRCMKSETEKRNDDQGGGRGY